MGATGENVRRVTSFGADPAWSPDGREIVFSTEAVASPYGRAGTSELWRVALGGARAAARSTREDAIQPSVSPHGLRIAFWALPAGGSQRDIWTIPVQGTRRRRKARAGHAGSRPWTGTRSGRRTARTLYFLSNRDGAMNLWRVPIDEASGKPLGPAAAREAARARGGRLRPLAGRPGVVYVDRETTYAIDRLTFDAEGRLIGKPEEIYESSQEMADFDVSPDGKLFAFDSRGGAQDDIFVVAVRRQGAAAAHRRRLPRPAPGVLSRRQAARVPLRPQRPVRHLDDRDRRQRPDADDEIDGRHDHRAPLVSGRQAHRDQQREGPPSSPRSTTRVSPRRCRRSPSRTPTFFLPLAWSSDGQHLLGAISRLPDRADDRPRLLFSGDEHALRTLPRHQDGRKRAPGRASSATARSTSTSTASTSPTSPPERSGSSCRTPTSAATTTSCAAARRPATSSGRATTPTSGCASKARRPGDAGSKETAAWRSSARSRPRTSSSSTSPRSSACAGSRSPRRTGRRRSFSGCSPRSSSSSRRASPSPRSPRRSRRRAASTSGRRRRSAQRQGFLAGWLYWASNITYFPTLTLSTVVFALYIFGTRFAALEQSPTYAAGASLVLLVIALVFNIVGMKTGKWVQNIGGLAQWIPSAALLLVGLIALFTSGSATPMPASSLVPDFAALPTILFFANLCFGFAGLELAPTMAGEVVEPRKTFPRAIVDLGPLDRGLLPARHDLASLGAAARARSRSSPASTRPSRRPARARAAVARRADRRS